MGEYPDALSAVGGAEVVGSEHEPVRIVPELGQVSEYDSEPPRSEYWGVFHVNVCGSYLAYQAGEVFPEAGALASDACAFAGCGDVLAGEAAAEDVDVAAPGPAFERGDVVPDGEGGQLAVALAGEEDGAGIGLDLAGADGAVPEHEVCEDAAACACK